MKSLLLLAGLLLSVAFISVALWPTGSPIPGAVTLENVSPKTISAVRGTSAVAKFSVRNTTNRLVTIEGVRTGCGCAVLVAKDATLVGTRLAPHSVLETTLKVDTTSRAMGDFVIPIDVFTADDVGVRQHLQASQSIRVNPGWATSKTRLALRVKSEDEEVVSDEFVLLQTSDEHPFEVTNTSITHLEMKVDVQEVDATEITEQVVVGTTPDVKWAATPRFRVRLSAPASTINARETAQLTMLLSHGLTRVLMDVQLLPVERALRVTPAELRLDGAAAVSMREFVISARNSLDSVRIALPAGISVASRTPLGKTLLKVTVQIDHATWKGENILIADTNGNEAILSIQPTS